MQLLLALILVTLVSTLVPESGESTVIRSGHCNDNKNVNALRAGGVGNEPESSEECSTPKPPPAPEPPVMCCAKHGKADDECWSFRDSSGMPSGSDPNTTGELCLNSGMPVICGWCTGGTTCGSCSDCGAWICHIHCQCCCRVSDDGSSCNQCKCGTEGCTYDWPQHAMIALANVTDIPYRECRNHESCNCNFNDDGQCVASCEELRPADKLAVALDWLMFGGQRR